MAEIRAFKGLRYNVEIAGDLNELVTPPYDIITPTMQDEFYKINKNNVIRLEFPKDVAGEDKYQTAGNVLNNFLEKGILKFEDKDAIYVYEQVFKDKNNVMKSLKGIVCLVKLEEFSKKVILPHEETLSKAKTDRFNLMSQTYCNFSQIYSLYVDEEKNISSIVEKATLVPSEISFKSFDDITQNLWTITDEKVIESIVKEFKNKQLFIADGHHRYETALNFSKKLAEDGEDNELSKYLMMFLIDIEDEGLLVYPTHRMIKDLKNFHEETLIKEIETLFEVEKRTDIANIEFNMKNLSDKKAFSLYTGKDYYYTLVLKDNSVIKQFVTDKSDTYCDLDVTVLHSLILEKILKIDKENMANQQNLTYTRDLSEAMSEVKNGRFQMSFILNSTKINQIKDISLENEKMPQKSTYFWPKLVTGIVMNKFK